MRLQNLAVAVILALTFSFQTPSQLPTTGAINKDNMKALLKDWENQEAFVSALGNTWRIVVASLLTYLVSQNHDVWAYDFWKRKTKGKYLWIRNNASTIVSQAIDTNLFVILAFYGTLPLTVLWNIIVGSFIIKVVIAIFDTPFLYVAKWYFKK